MQMVQSFQSTGNISMKDIDSQFEQRKNKRRDEILKNIQEHGFREQRKESLIRRRSRISAKSNKSDKNE